LDAAAVAAERGLVGDGGLVGAGRGGLRLGVPRRVDPGERGRAGWRGGEGELSRPAGGDGTARRAGRELGRGAGARPRGAAELLAGPVPLLRRARPAADGQRPGTALRGAPLPRTAVERPEGGLARAGGAGVGAAAVGAGDTSARRGAGRRLCAAGPGRVAATSYRSGPAPV